MSAPEKDPFSAKTKTSDDDFIKVNDNKKSSKNGLICYILITIIVVVVTIVALSSGQGYDINQPVMGY